MRVITVSGAPGFVGSRLCERLISDGWQVLRALRRAGDVDGVVVGDLGPENDWSEALANAEFVVHLAARVHVMKDRAIDSLAEFRRVNVDGTLNLARQAAASGVNRFVYLSSIKVNGEETLSNQPFHEGNIPSPTDPYAISKWEAEQGLIALSSETGMEVVIIRPPLVYGPGVKANFLGMMRWLVMNMPLPFGAIHNKRSLVALDNLIDLIVTCIDHPAAANQIFLVSDGEDLSTTELLRRTAAAMGKQAWLIPVPQRLIELGLVALGKKALAARLCSSLQVEISKAQDLLDWTPPVSVDTGLASVADWFMTEKQLGNQ